MAVVPPRRLHQVGVGVEAFDEGVGQVYEELGEVPSKAQEEGEVAVHDDSQRLPYQQVGVTGGVVWFQEDQYYEQVWTGGCSQMIQIKVSVSLPVPSEVSLPFHYLLPYCLHDSLYHSVVYACGQVKEQIILKGTL